ncbi:hypothetical protein FANTH_9525 [Fusarium anthophilum]|uniref:Uncharacterized protein n=1 Tax=Fusarium anthophilum TaxID=48485 RepID=A0A8H4Z5Z8_9HYPO|nr:hypothetical protein FANTH_9525 [Fusarium anthophilum]
MAQSIPKDQTFITASILRELEFISPQSSPGVNYRSTLIPPGERIHVVQSSVATIQKRCGWGLISLRESNGDSIIIGAWTTQGTKSPDGSLCYPTTIDGNSSTSTPKLIVFGATGGIEAREAKQYAENIPTEEGKEGAESVTTINEEPDMEASRDTDNIPTCHDTQENFQFAEGEQKAESVTVIDSEPQPGLMDADQKAATICLKVQDRPEDKIMAWVQGVRDATNALLDKPYEN